MSVDALSLACNIITVIDFGHKFYETVRNVYDNGASDPTTEYKANELAALAGRLRTSRNQALHSLPNNDQLFMVADKCIKAAEDLHNEIRRLVPSNSSSRTTKTLRSLLSASKRTWRHNRIEQLSKSLDECQATMQTSVLLHMYQSGEADKAMRLDEFSKLDSRLQSFIHAVSKQDLQVSQLLTESRSLHQETRAVIRQEMTDLRNSQISKGQLTQLKASLRFPEMNQRYNELGAAHEKSFRWLLDDSEDSNLEEEPDYIRRLRNETFGDFKQWLTSETDSKLYWVSGKPGAGKSTLMKYLSRQMENANLVEGPHLVIRHFFWLGTSAARSRLNDMQGMFITLLHQLLEHEVSGEPLAATLLMQNPRLSRKHTATDWGLEELEAITQKALEIISRQYLVFILVDALDEHLPVSDHGELVDVFQRFEDMTNVRLILSSRRERIFDTRLARSRQLRLQDLTGSDIYHFSLGSLLRRLDFQEGPTSELAEELAVEIVLKAEGVFLWARLAVNSLKRGFIDGNSEIEIRDRLNDMPTELSDYFKSIWMRLGDDQKRYRAFAANMFSLLVCYASDHLSMVGYSEFDLLMMSLALNPNDAHLLIHGETHLDETYLVKLCQKTERLVLSHCAGLVEFNHGQNFRNGCRYDCAPANVDMTIAMKDVRFVHRTAREFFHETPEGKRLIDFNDMAHDGPNFRFALAYVARLAAFRDLRNTFHRCSLLNRVTMRKLFEIIRDLENECAISTAQQYSLVALIHELHFRFSGHPDNPIFENWVALPGRSLHVAPFIVIAASYGHFDYAMQYMEMQATSGRVFPINTYGMVLKASLASCLGNGMTQLLKSETGGLRLKSLERLVHYFQARCFPSTVYHARLGESTWNDGHECLSICHLVLNLLFDMVNVGWRTWEISPNGVDMVVNVALNLAKLLGSSDTGLFQPILCTFSPLLRGWRLWIADFVDDSKYEPFSPAQATRVDVVCEVSPIWLFRYIARVAASVQGMQTICGGLMEIVDLQCQNGREFKGPRPVLLLGSISPLDQSRGVMLHHEGVKEIPSETQCELSEMLVGPLFEASHDLYDALIQRFREIWENESIDCVRGTKYEEPFISYGLCCSEEEVQEIHKSCNVIMAGGGVWHYYEDDERRFLIPPDGRSRDEERLSYYVFHEQRDY